MYALVFSKVQKIKVLFATIWPTSTSKKYNYLKANFKFYVSGANNKVI
jgi:hypothetical protein